MVDQAILGLDSGRLFFTAVVQWHFHGHPGVGFNALEVDVQDLLLVRVHLQIAQQNLLGFAGQFHLEDGGVEGFFLDGVPQGVVIDLDQRRPQWYHRKRYRACDP